MNTSIRVYPVRGPDAWREAIADVLAKVEQRDAGMLDEIRTALMRYREGVQRLMAEVPQTNYGMARMEAVQGEMDRLARQLSYEIAGKLRTSVGAAAELGRAATADPLAAMAATSGSAELSRAALLVPVVDQRAVALAQHAAGDMILGASQEFVTEVRSLTTAGVLGGKNPYEIQQAILGELDRRGMPTPSAFSSVWSRAEAIARTEINGAFSRSNNSTLRQTSLRNPGLLWKMWLAGNDGRTRPSHLALYEETQARPIPAHGKFRLVGADGTYLCDGPHDPTLPAGEVVNCRCTTAAVLTID